MQEARKCDGGNVRLCLIPLILNTQGMVEMLEGDHCDPGGLSVAEVRVQNSALQLAGATCKQTATCADLKSNAFVSRIPDPQFSREEVAKIRRQAHQS